MAPTTLTKQKEAASATDAQRRTQRLLAVGSAVLAAVAVWALAAHVLGVAVRAPGTAGRGAADIGPAQVVAASAVASLAGWAVLAVLERLTARAAGIWAGLALGVLVVSFGGPLSGAGISAGSRVTLLALHVVVAAVLIPVLSRTSVAR